MDFIAKKTTISQQKTQCAVVFAFDKTLLASAQKVDERHGGVIRKLLESKDLAAKAGQCAWISVPAADSGQPYNRILLAQLGKPTKPRTHSVAGKDWRTSSAAIAASLAASAAREATVFLDDLLTDDAESTASLCKTLALETCRALYRYGATKAKVEIPALNKIAVASVELAQARRGLATGRAIGTGVNTARELGNLPANICTPRYLANLAKSYAEECDKLSVKVLGEKQMSKLGMGALLSVARGSEEDAKLIVMEYRNGTEDSAPHVLVGKGITFDTGGISLKPGAAMDEMKFDMCGAASVFGAVKTLIEMQAPLNVVAIVAAAENMPSGSATKPGDVVTSMSGQTVEILNTDAEGRLVLCDALTYAERFTPKSVVDVATLTGACVIALGNHASGLYSNNQKLARALLEAGERAMDRAWQMPLWEEYQKQLDSNFADIANIGGKEAGSVTAACFLSRFTKKYPWAHLDVAGTAWLSGKKKGATGRPVGLLVEYLLNS